MSQGARLAVVLGAILAGEVNELLWRLQRVEDLLRLAAEKHVRLGFHNEAGALNLSSDAIHRVLLRFRQKLGKAWNPE